MGSATSSIPAEPIVTVAAVAGALGYGYVHYFRPAAQPGDEDAYSDTSVGASKATSTFRGQKKRGRKLHLPGDATLKNLDFLDAPVPGSLSASTSASKSRERQRQSPSPQQQQQQQREAPAAHAPSRDVVPGGFDGTVTSVDDARDTQQEQSQAPLEQVQQQHVSVPVGATKKPKRKKGKKAAAPSDPSSASAVGATPSLATGASAAAAAEDGHDERWTRVEARKKKVTVPPRDGLAELQSAEGTAADVTTSDAGVTTSVTGNSSPVTERTTTEDELRSELDESAPEVSASSVQGSQPSIVPVRPPPGEKPAKGFSWEDYEGVQVDEDASDEDDGGWGVVRSRRKPNKAVLEGGATATTADASPQTKKQRQNAQRREALKEVKREREAQQQAAFVTHKRELERARVTEHVGATSKRTGSRFDSLG
ncbi:hypothetical protein DFH94DRAFT_488709 [Russula ochroleuca]|uniref:Uncharacterized protein n=1 Tax=Russula ochroleuca TaxID=152965 RepID=A0A9P5MVD8_9AGAM|nr:hypothetical protein DFH94DRAFT_488709 [Russula ochroleuca]